MDVKDFFAPADKIDDGAWVGDIPNFGEVRLKVRGTGARMYRERIEVEMRKVPKNQRDAKTGAPFLAVREAIVAKLLHEVVLIDWEGIANEGKPLPYSKDLAKEWCENPSYRQFAEAVLFAATSVDQGRNDGAEDKEAVTGN